MKCGDQEDKRSFQPTSDFYMTANGLLDCFIPLVGLEGVVLYEIYNRLQNKQLGYAFPSMRHVSRATGLGLSTINAANKVLKEYGLISVERGRGGRANKYFVHEPKVTDEILKELRCLKRPPLADLYELVTEPVTSALPTGKHELVTEPVTSALPTGKHELVTEPVTSALPTGEHLVTEPVTSALPTGEHDHKNTNKEDKFKKTTKQEAVVSSSQSSRNEDEEKETLDEDADVDHLVECYMGIVPDPNTKTVKRFITRLVKKHGEDCVSRKLELMAIEARPIESPEGWLTSACRENYSEEKLAKAKAGEERRRQAVADDYFVDLLKDSLAEFRKAMDEQDEKVDSIIAGTDPEIRESLHERAVELVRQRDGIEPNEMGADIVIKYAERELLREDNQEQGDDYSSRRSGMKLALIEMINDARKEGVSVGVAEKAIDEAIQELPEHETEIRDKTGENGQISDDE